MYKSCCHKQNIYSSAFFKRYSGTRGVSLKMFKVKPFLRFIYIVFLYDCGPYEQKVSEGTKVNTPLFPHHLEHLVCPTLLPWILRETPAATTSRR